MLTRESSLRIRERALVRRLGDGAVVLDLETGTYFGLDPVGARFVELLGEGTSIAQVARALVEEFDVEETAVAEDLLGLARDMLSNGLLETA